MGDIWGYNDGNGRLKSDYKSSQTGVIYPAGTNISLVIINDTETKKILDAAAAEQLSEADAADNAVSAEDMAEGADEGGETAAEPVSGDAADAFNAVMDNAKKRAEELDGE